MVSSGSAIKLAILAILVVLISLPAVLTGYTNINAYAECEGCLVGTMVKHMVLSSSEAIKPTGTPLEVTVLLNVTCISESREYLVQLTVNLAPASGTEATIFYTPPLIDMVIYSNVGKYVWSADKVFIQAILERKLPLSESISMKVKADCIHAVEAVIKPLKLRVPFGKQVSTPSTFTETEVSYYIVYGVFNPPIKYDGVTVSRISLIVAAPKGVSTSVVEGKVREVLALHLGNLSKILEICVVPLAPSELYAKEESIAVSEVISQTVPRKLPTTTPSAGTFETAEATTTGISTVKSTTELSASTSVRPGKSIPPPTVIPTSAPVSPTTTQQTHAATKMYVPRELSVTIAIAAALIAGLAAYIALIKPLK